MSQSPISRVNLSELIAVALWALYEYGRNPLFVGSAFRSAIIIIYAVAPDPLRRNPLFVGSTFRSRPAADGRRAPDTCRNPLFVGSTFRSWQLLKQPKNGKEVAIPYSSGQPFGVLPSLFPAFALMCVAIPYSSGQPFGGQFVPPPLSSIFLPSPPLIAPRRDPLRGTPKNSPKRRIF